MNTTRAHQLLALLDTSEFRTAQSFADSLGCSNKTVRNTLHELGDTLEGHGAHIESKSRFGYRLIIEDQELFDGFRQMRRSRYGKVPEGGRERIDYLLMGLLFNHNYAKGQDICSVLYISPTTYSACLKSVEQILTEYDLAIDRRPGHGVKVLGDENDIRRLIVNRFLDQRLFPAELGEDVELKIRHYGGIIKGLLAKYNIPLSEFAFENFVEMAFVSFTRVSVGFGVDTEGLDFESLPQIKAAEHDLVVELMDSMGFGDYMEDTSIEELYLEVLLASKRIVVEDGGAEGVVMHEQCDRLTDEILDVLSSDYGINLHDNFNLRMALNQHLAPMDIRMRFSMPVRNPLLGQIKENYPLAYQMAVTALGVLERYYGEPVPEAEAGFIALILQLAIEKMREAHCRSILIVCSTGKSSSQLLKYKFERQFGGQVEHIYTCDHFELSSFDFSLVDYVVTTIKIPYPLPKPVLEIGPFLGEDDIARITKMLNDEDAASILERYMGAERFIKLGADSIFGRTKEEILAGLCMYISTHENVSENFYDMVLEREGLMQMDLGGLVALPHPNGIASERTFAYVLVLAEPVIWNSSKVRIVILTSMGSDDAGDDDRHLLNEEIARFVLDEKAVEGLLEEPSYARLVELVEG